MIGILNDCKQIENSTSTECENDINIPKNTKIAYLITTEYQTIIDLCKPTVLKNTFKPSSYNDVNDTNLVITSANMMVFWDEYKSNPIFVVDRKSKLTKELFEGNSIVIVSHMMFTKNLVFFELITFNRLILHNLNAKVNTKTITYDFKWTVFSNEGLMNEEDVKKIACVPNILIKDVSEKRNIGTRVILSKKPIEVLTLDRLIDEVLMNNMKSVNIKNVIKHLVHSSIKSEKNIIKSVLRKLNDKINVCKLYEYCVETKYFAESDERNTKLKTIKAKRDEISVMKENLIDRIKESSVCFICYSSIDIKCVLRCCANQVCLECINRWMCVNDTCPLCKKDKINYFVLDDSYSEDEIYSIDRPKHLSRNHSIFQNFNILIQILLKKRKSKIAIIGNDNAFIRRFSDILDEQAILNVTFKGNINTLRKTLKRLNDLVSIVFINNSKVYGSLLLNNVTDVILLSEDIRFDGTTIISKELLCVWTLAYAYDSDN